MKKGRSNQTIVRSAIDVKTWLARIPSVDEVRPGQCPRCAAASRPVGQGLQIWGHGLRDRQSRGPLEALGDPVEVTLRVRRYLCRPCRAVIVVVPLGVIAGRLFAAAAIGLALALFGVEGLPLAKVRQRVSPWRRVGATAYGSWLAPRRWVRAIREGRLFASVRRSPTHHTARQVAGSWGPTTACTAGSTSSFSAAR